jgi:pimeloyl-ACP methyl ester carboxylesterase
MPTVPANGMELFYEDHGCGESLLLIGGFGCDHTIWSLIEPVLAKTYRVVSFDNRGVGQSSTPDGPYSIRQMAEDAAALLDAIGISQAHVAGHSMGGQIAQELALTRPDKVCTLLLLSSCARCDERGKSLIEGLGELPGLVDVRSSARLIMPWLYTNAFFAEPGAVDKLLKSIVAYPFLAPPQTVYDQSRAISSFDVSDRVGAIRCPALVLVGAQDIMVPPKLSEQLAQSIPAATLVVVDNVGHGLLIESPQAVAKAMLDFLTRHRVSR